MNKFPLNLINLKYFLDAVKHGSISASAKVNFVTQSAISQGIAKLEESCGCELLFHHPKKFKLTDEGFKLFESGKEIFQALRKAEESLSIQSKKRIEFACTHSFALALLPHFLEQAQLHLPQIQFKCRLGQAYTVMEWVKKGVIDFGILLDNSEMSAFECSEFYQGSYKLYVSKKCKNPTSLPFLLDSEEREETNLLKKAYRTKYKKEMPVLMEISSWEMVAKLTEKGFGVGFFPDYVAEPRKEFLKLYPDSLITLPYKIYAIFSRDYKRPPHILDFLKILQKKPPKKVIFIKS